MLSRRSKVAIACTGVVILAAAMLYPLMSNMMRTKISDPLVDTTFPPPLTERLSSQPSYAVSISDTNGQSTVSANFNPSVISIPAGMTVIWTNNGAGQHTVTTVSSSSYSPPEAVDSKMIAPDGGSFSYTFTKQGIYRYTDLMNPKASGIVDVGSTILRGANFDMLVGGMDSLLGNPGHGITVRFMPKTLSIPPTTAITYQVTISGPAGALVSKQFDDTDGMLDLELVPTGPATNTVPPAQQFVTSGPDFAGQEGYGSTGTFHIQGPFMHPGTQYKIDIAALYKDGSQLSNISDTFALTPSS